MSKEKDTSTLETEFEAAMKAANNEMEEHLTAAKDALNKAIKVAEKYGVPFRDSICFLENGYIPESFESKFGDLDEQFVYDVSGVYSEYGYDSGWVHSAVC